MQLLSEIKQAADANTHVHSQHSRSFRLPETSPSVTRSRIDVTSTWSESRRWLRHNPPRTRSNGKSLVTASDLRWRTAAALSSGWDPGIPRLCLRAMGKGIRSFIPPPLSLSRSLLPQVDRARQLLSILSEKSVLPAACTQWPFQMSAPTKDV